MVVLIRMCIFSCLLIRKMKISISFGDVFDRICHRKRLSSRRVFVFVLFSNFQSSQLFVTFYISNQNATSIPKKSWPGVIFTRWNTLLNCTHFNFYLGTLKIRMKRFKRTNSNIEVGYPAPIFFFQVFLVLSNIPQNTFYNSSK